MATRGQIRILALLRSAGRAGLLPLHVDAVHSLAYLANVLSPVWDLQPVEGKVLKRSSGPFYPDLQRDLDRLVGIGLVSIAELRYRRSESGVRLDASFALNAQMAQDALDAVDAYVDERHVSAFLDELCLAVSGFTRAQLAASALQDATYSDTLTAAGTVLDFAEWRRRNYSSRAAQAFAALAPTSIALTPAEEVHLYLRHLQSRLVS